MAWDHAGLYGPNNFEYPDGDLAIGASYTVRQGGQLADLWADRDRSVELANPGVVDALGNLTFYADPGIYQLTVDGSGPAQTFTVTVAPDPTDLGDGADPSEEGPVELLPLVVSRLSPWSSWTDGVRPISHVSTFGFPAVLVPSHTPISGLVNTGGGVETLMAAETNVDYMLSCSVLLGNFATGELPPDDYSIKIDFAWSDGNSEPEISPDPIYVDPIRIAAASSPSEEQILEWLSTQLGGVVQVPEGKRFLVEVTVSLVDRETHVAVLPEDVDGLVTILSRMSIYEGETLLTPRLVVSSGLMAGMDTPIVYTVIHDARAGTGSTDKSITVTPQSIAFDIYDGSFFESEHLGEQVVSIGVDDEDDGPHTYLQVGKLRGTEATSHPDDLIRRGEVASMINGLGVPDPWESATGEYESNLLPVSGDTALLNLRTPGDPDGPEDLAPMVTRVYLTPGSPKLNISFSSPGEDKYSSCTVVVINQLTAEAALADVTYSTGSGVATLPSPGLVAGGLAVYRFDVFGQVEGDRMVFGAAVYTSEGDAGRQLYSGSYEAGDLDAGVEGVVIPFGNPGWYVPLVNSVNAGLDPGFARFTATTQRTRLVWQAICWTAKQSPGPDDDVFAFGDPITWQLTQTSLDGNTTSAPDGNPRAIVRNDDGRVLRQLEIVVPTVPGDVYRWRWYFDGNGYVQAGPRQRLIMNVYSA